MLTAYSRVTVVTAERIVDLALPNGLPLADVIPQVMRYAAPDSDAPEPVGWTLARLGGTALALTSTLADAGVLDGDVLELRAEGEEVAPARVEDVRDAVEDSVDAAGGVWTRTTTGSFVVLAASVALAAAGLLSWVRLGLDPGLSDLDSPGSAVLALLALLFATWWAGRTTRALDAQVAAAVAIGWGALLGRSIGDAGNLDRWPTITLSVLLAAVVAAGCRVLGNAMTGHAAFGAVLLVAGLVESGTGLADLRVDQVQRVLAVLAVLAIAVVPRISLSVGGLASADYRVRHVGQLDLAALRRRFRASNAILVGSVLGLAGVAAWAGVVLELEDRTWDRTLALVVAIALVLRSRLFSRTQHMLAPRAAGLVVIGFVACRQALVHDDLARWLVGAVAVVVALGIGLASVPMSDISRARVKRTLNTAEFVAIVVMVVVALGALGVYDRLGGLFG